MDLGYEVPAPVGATVDAQPAAEGVFNYELVADEGAPAVSEVAPAAATPAVAETVPVAPAPAFPAAPAQAASAASSRHSLPEPGNSLEQYLYGGS